MEMNDALPPLSDTQIVNALQEAGVQASGSISKIPVGFSSDVYSVGDEYIFKAAKSAEDDASLKKEIYMCNLLKGKVPAPEIIYANTGKNTIGRAFFVYKKIQGDNLYTKWHTYTVEQRKSVIQQICRFLKTINSQPLDDVASALGLTASVPWSEKILSMIESERQKSLAKGVLPAELDARVQEFIEKNASALTEGKMALTYYDAHFDNFLVNDGTIVGMLDFERTDILSIDYALYVPLLMTQRPLKYPSEESKRFIKPEDYADLMSLYQEYYPELFQFPQLETRLNFYLIHHALEDLYWWPESKNLKEDFERYLAYAK
jgi:aminoglycoside phosphotransferase (APT) family kinase protein